MPQIDPNFTNKEKVAVAYNPGEISLVIVGANLGQVIYIGWTANYVGYLENGHSQKAPSGFVRLAAMRWPQTVKEVTAEARSRSNARSR